MSREGVLGKKVRNTKKTLKKRYLPKKTVSRGISQKKPWTCLLWTCLLWTCLLSLAGCCTTSYTTQGISDPPNLASSTSASLIKRHRDRGGVIPPCMPPITRCIALAPLLTLQLLPQCSPSGIPVGMQTPQ